MYPYRIYFQRRRKLVTRVAFLAVLGLGATMAALPRADAQGVGAAPTPALLLEAEVFSSARFGEFHWPLQH